jgi:predicted GNAT family N-acyltransferase
MRVIRITQPEDLKKALDLRVEVFVNEQKVPAEEELDQYDVSPEAARHVLVMDGDEPAAAGRFIPYDLDTAKLQRIAVRKKYRGQGVGRQLISALEEWAKEQGFTKGLLDAQCQAEPFYEKLGYRALSPETFMDAGIPHIRMVKTF